MHQALGCTLYELCALHKPFEASNMPAIIFGIMRNRPPPLPREFSEEMRGMVAWLMQVGRGVRAAPFVREHGPPPARCRQTRPCAPLRPTSRPPQSCKQDSHSGTLTRGAWRCRWVLVFCHVMSGLRASSLRRGALFAVRTRWITSITPCRCK